MATVKTPQPPAAPRYAQLTPLASLGSDGIGDDDVVLELEVADVFLDAHSVEFAELGECHLRSGSMANSNWYKSLWRDLRLDTIDLANASFEQASWRRLSLQGCRLTGLELSDSTLEDLDFHHGVLDEANFRMASLRRVRFDGTRMAGVDFSNARAVDVAFIDCDLTGAHFDHFRAERVRFENCRLDGVQGVTGLRGSTISTLDLMELTTQLAAALGITLEA